MKTRVVILTANMVNVEGHSFSWRVLKALAEKRGDMRWNEETSSLEMEIKIDVDKSYWNNVGVKDNDSRT